MGFHRLRRNEGFSEAGVAEGAEGRSVGELQSEVSGLRSGCIRLWNLRGA